MLKRSYIRWLAAIGLALAAWTCLRSEFSEPPLLPGGASSESDEGDRGAHSVMRSPADPMAQPRSVDELKDRIRTYVEREGVAALLPAAARGAPAVHDSDDIEDSDDAPRSRRADDRPFTRRIVAVGTPAEQAVLDVYENLVATFHGPEQDCATLAESVWSFAKEGQGALQGLARERAMLDEAGQREAHERLEAEGAAQLKQLREWMRDGLARCPQEGKLQEALRLLASSF